MSFILLNLYDPLFDAVEKTGGSKVVTLTIAQVPKHGHGVTLGGRSIAGDSPHNHHSDHEEFKMYASVAANNIDRTWPSGTYENGCSQAHNNLQPSITCYMYKRLS